MVIRSNNEYPQVPDQTNVYHPGRHWSLSVKDAFIERRRIHQQKSLIPLVEVFVMHHDAFLVEWFYTWACVILLYFPWPCNRSFCSYFSHLGECSQIFGAHCMCYKCKWRLSMRKPYAHVVYRLLCSIYNIYTIFVLPDFLVASVQLSTLADLSVTEKIHLCVFE